MAFQHCMDFLLAYGLLITTFISDRHSTIASHMKNVLTNIVHYFDIWHLKKSKDIPVFTITVDCTILHYPSINSGCNHRPASRLGQLQAICTHCQSWGSGISLNQCERPGHWLMHYVMNPNPYESSVFSLYVFPQKSAKYYWRLQNWKTVKPYLSG